MNVCNVFAQMAGSGAVVSHRQMEFRDFRVVFAMASDIPVMRIQRPGPYRTHEPSAQFHLHFKSSTPSTSKTPRNLQSPCFPIRDLRHVAFQTFSLVSLRSVSTGPVPDHWASMVATTMSACPGYGKEGSQHRTQRGRKSREYNRTWLGPSMGGCNAGYKSVKIFAVSRIGSLGT